MTVTFEQVKKDQGVKSYIQKADEALEAIGFTEHSFPHVLKVASTAKFILETLGYTPKEIELAQIAGYLHDIGNLLNRVDHAQSGAIMAFRILDHMGMDPEDIAVVVSAIGNHDEETAFPVNSVAAALILADKTDVRSSRVRDPKEVTADIHDRVNFAVKKANLTFCEENTVLQLVLTIDTTICSVMDYFQIFLGRMLLCQKAAEKLSLHFRLWINGQQVL